VQNSSRKDKKSIRTSEFPRKRKPAEAKNGDNHAGKIKVPRKCFAVLDIDTITDLKDWAVVGNLLILVGGILEGGCFLFFRPGIDKMIPTVSVAAGILIIVLGVLVEQRKFKHFAEKLKKGKTIGELHFIGERKVPRRKKQRGKSKNLRLKEPVCFLQQEVEKFV